MSKRRRRRLADVEEDYRCNTTDCSIQVAVVVFILKGNSILLGKRRSYIGMGTFALPGGVMKYWESFERCASREVLEETGLIIKEVMVLDVVNTIHDDVPKKPHFVTVVASAKLSDIVKQTPENREPKKCEGWRWYNWSQLPQPLFAPLQELLSTGFDPFERPKFQQQTQQTATGTQTQQTQQTATGQQQQPQHQPDGGSAAFAANYRLQWHYGNPVYYQPTSAAFAGQLPANYGLQWHYGNPVYYQPTSAAFAGQLPANYMLHYGNSVYSQPTFGQQQGYGQYGYSGASQVQHVYARPSSTAQYGYDHQQGYSSNPAYPPQDGSNPGYDHQQGYDSNPAYPPQDGSAKQDEI